MACVKTAISLQEPLFKRADRLARKLGISRSQLFSRALEEYLNKHQAEDLIERINEAHDGFPDDEEKRFLKAAKASFARLADREEW